MRRTEAALAVLFAAAIGLAGGAALYFVSTRSVHGDPAAVPSTPAAAPAERDSGAVDEARRLARSLVVDENLPGLSVAVAHDGRIAWAEGFGWADVEDRVPVTPLTRFRIGAVSMPLTAAAVGLLLERGRLDLDAPVQRYVPAFPEKQWRITTRQVMGHVSGIQRDPMPGRHCATLDEAVQIFRADPLRFRPGTEYRYSVYGWILVSAVIEGAAGEPYLAFMHREVLARAGMEHTVPDETRGVADRAWFYFPRTALDTKLGLQDAPEADYSCYAGAGAFVSTPSDLVRFGLAMLKPGLLKAETIALLQAPLRLESGASTEYGLGWRTESVQLAGAPARMVGHRGSSSGGTTSLLTFPDLGLAIAVTTNVSHATGVAPFALKVAEAFRRIVPASPPLVEEEHEVRYTASNVRYGTPK
jgi:CubicO group peptidase (beta-lactamase class C family)